MGKEEQRIFRTRIQLKRDTSSNWEKNNPQLLNGEMILVDTASGQLRTKIGDGQKTYTQLPFTDEGGVNAVNTHNTDPNAHKDMHWVKSTKGAASLNKVALDADTLNGLSSDNFLTKQESQEAHWISSYNGANYLNKVAALDADTLNGHSSTYFVNQEEASHFATLNNLSNYSSKLETNSKLDEMKQLMTSNYATKNNLNEYTKTAELVTTYATKDSLNNYATKDSLNNYATKNNLNEYTKTADLSTTYATKAENSEKMPKAGGAFTGSVTVPSNSSYTTKQLRNIIFSTVAPTASDGQNGDIWIEYGE